MGEMPPEDDLPIMVLAERLIRDWNAWLFSSAPVHREEGKGR